MNRTDSFSLHHTMVQAPAGAPSRWLLILHGFLGRGRNWLGIARQWVASRPQWGVILPDLRLHGDSGEAPAPHTMSRCADDVLGLMRDVGAPATAICGHSFGAKVALQVSARTSLSTVILLDATPGAQESDPNPVHDLLRTLEAVPRFWPQRLGFTRELQARGVARRTAQWLCSNLQPAEGGYLLTLDYPGLGALLEDHHRCDLWSVVEAATAPVHVVLAGRSSHVPPAAVVRYHDLGRTRPDVVRVHRVEHAGHWLHVDRPEELLRTFQRILTALD